MDQSTSRSAWPSQLKEDNLPIPTVSTSSSSSNPSVQGGLAAPEKSQRKAVSVRSGTPPLVAPLPSNAVVFHSPKDDSYPQYLANQFPGSDKVLAQHMAEDGPSSKTQNEWLEPQHGLERPNSWTSSIFRALKNDKLQEAQHDEEEEMEKPWWTARQDHDGFYSIGAFLFLFGFLFPPLWWLGSCWPTRIERGGKLAERWQKLNKIMSLFFSVLVIAALITVGAIYGSQKKA